MNNSFRGRKISLFELSALIIIAIGSILSFIAVRAQAVNNNFLEVYFLDVGQGDAIFIQSPNGNQILIDGGPDNKVIQELSKIMPFNDRSIDMLILTHPHADHVNGLIEVLKRYDVGQIIENNYPFNSSEYQKWNELKLKAKVTQAHTGQIVNLGMGVKLEILYPYPENAGEPVSNPNNASIVSKLIYGGESVLLTGDAESPIEKKLVALGADLDSDFLKVGHHGSKTSTTDDFLTAVSPKEAFIEVGAKNTYGHPSPEILERLAKNGIKYYRTDKNGSIELMLDGRSFSVNSI